MNVLLEYPFRLLAVSFVTLCLCAWFGADVLGRRMPRSQEARRELTTVLTACLTLLGLIIGFSFSMAIDRYDLRSQYEESETNAIRTEYLRADLLPPQDAARLRLQLKAYLAQRIAFFTTRDRQQLRQINAQTAQLQGRLWSSLRATAATRPDPISALVISGMNEVFDFEGGTQAAWRNRIPAAAWTLMGLIAILCNVLLGFSARQLKGRAVFLVMPLVVSIAFFLIADIDSPRGGGVVHVAPYNLLDLAAQIQ